MYSSTSSVLKLWPRQLPKGKWKKWDSKARIDVGHFLVLLWHTHTQVAVPVRASRKEVSVHWRAVCHPSLTISISIHVPYGLRTHLEPIVHTTDIKIPIISLSLCTLSQEDLRVVLWRLSLQLPAANDEEKKVCQITWTFKLQNIALCIGLKTVGINPVPFRTDFSILPARFRIFGQIRIRYGNTGYQIRNRDGNGLTVFPIIFGFPIFVRDIPLLPIRDIPFFCSWWKPAQKN